MQKIENMRLADENAKKVEKSERLNKRLMARLDMSNIEYSDLMSGNDDDKSAVKRLKLNNDTDM
jgi:hypothetical protein